MFRGWRVKCYLGTRDDRETLHSEEIKVTNNVKDLLNALQQSINEAILGSHDVAAALTALKHTGRNPVFSIEVAIEEAPELADEPFAPSCFADYRPFNEELVLSDEDVEFLVAMGITAPSWTSKAGTA
jgi:hypothetical protein